MANIWAMSSDAFENRKRLTFEQAEGAESLPTQLKPKEVSELLRSALWAAVYEDMRESQYQGDLTHSWENVTYSWHVYRKCRPVDEFRPSFKQWVQEFKTIILSGSYVDVFGLLQFILRHQSCPHRLKSRIPHALAVGRAAYRVVDGDTIAPFGSEAELETVKRAFADLAATEFHGARKHLRTAAEELTGGKYAESIRESIHAVESVVRVLEPKGDFAKALAKLDAKAKIHGALKAGFGSLYGFTSDESGIRHPFLEKGTAGVDETDALFMICACAAFVSYLINKARTAGLLTAAKA
jgi:hypothetical protein